MAWGRIKVFGKNRAASEAPRHVLRYEVEREDDGRYLVEVVDLPGVMAYGETEVEAINRAAALALRVIAERIDNGEEPIGRSLSLVLQHV